VAETVGQVRLFRFGRFEVDLRAGELRKAGVKLKFAGQPFQVLTVLLEHAGEVVTREELQKQLWPDTFVDVDHNLNTALNKIREVLGNSALSRPTIVRGADSETARTKSELLKYLKDSFDYGNRVLATLTAQNALVEGRYAGPNTKLGISVVAVWHIADHYGQLVEYRRMNSIVPPATQKYGLKVR
jgi:Transcriptional regulatory protein, C terminal